MPLTDSSNHILKFYAGIDPRNLPAYSLHEAMRVTGVPEVTLRSWLGGRNYKTRKGMKRFNPIIHRPDPKLSQLSFTNLIESYVLSAIRRHHHISLGKVRDALTYLEEHFRSEHPLAEETFETDGLDLFIRKGDLINVSKKGQLAFSEILKPYLRRIEWDKEGLAVRLYPVTRDVEPNAVPRDVVIDPFVSFGRPVIVGTGIPTSIIAERYKAGESLEELASDYNCDKSKIDEAFRYEFRAA